MHVTEGSDDLLRLTQIPFVTNLMLTDSVNDDLTAWFVGIVLKTMYFTFTMSNKVTKKAQQLKNENFHH